MEKWNTKICGEQEGRLFSLLRAYVLRRFCVRIRPYIFLHVSKEVQDKPKHEAGANFSEGLSRTVKNSSWNSHALAEGSYVLATPVPCDARCCCNMLH